MVKCKCGYEWNTKSQMIFVCCPCCGKKVKIRESFNPKENTDTSTNDELEDDEREIL